MRIRTVVTLAFWMSVVFIASIAQFVSAQPTAQDAVLNLDKAFTQWEFSGVIFDITVFDDGSGPALYAAGCFRSIIEHRYDGDVEVPAHMIARWDGVRWSEVGGGINVATDAGLKGCCAKKFCIWDDGRGPALYVAGDISDAGPIKVSNLARWDGHEWSSIVPPPKNPRNFSRRSPEIVSMVVYDDGDERSLYIGGRFEGIGDVDARNIARWDGQNWHRVGNSEQDGPTGTVRCMAAYDGDLYVGGSFEGINKQRGFSPFLARWNRDHWSNVPGVLLQPGPVHADAAVEEMQVFDEGSGPALFFVGNVQLPKVGAGLFRWDTHHMSAPARSSVSPNGIASCMAIYDDGAGPALWIGFDTVNDEDCKALPSLARWSGRTMKPADGHLKGRIYALESFDTLDGQGPLLYAAGDFQTMYPSGEPMKWFARWKPEKKSKP